MLPTTAIISMLAAQALAHPPGPWHAWGPGHDHNSTTLKPPPTRFYPPNADCSDYSIPVSVVYSIVDFNFTHWEDNYQLEQFLVAASTRAIPGTPGIVNGLTQQNASYNIAASFCTPKVKSGKEGTVILATHGIGPAREQFNPSYEPDDYSFVQWVVGKGYSIFFYDRVGTGESSSEDGWVTQLSTGVAVLGELLPLVRSGEYTSAIGVPEKLVLLGFSLGSSITQALITATPESADAVVITSIGMNLTVGVNTNGLIRSFVPRIASTLNEKSFGSLNTGYLSWVDKFAQAATYFDYPNYAPSALDYLETHKAAFTIGEFLTTTAGPQDTSNYTGPALQLNGKTDYIMCDGYCPGVFEQPAQTYYRNARPFVQHLHPESGHQFMFHRNATGAFGVITDFLDKYV
ncbi:hypothetical protein LTR97_004326 [Elasticomyces elasticus]|uniref:Serine aminopeptidase S33 domain-containing protein n=1 Tax=Elasticomyces elasticus TaxID=574655 RepID=A0AAN7W6E0_9PEZI|nr:hypothetical protein LTR97_004326 [Elasticomyces elasticus]